MRFCHLNSLGALSLGGRSLFFLLLSLSKILVTSSFSFAFSWLVEFLEKSSFVWSWL